MPKQIASCELATSSTKCPKPLRGARLSFGLRPAIDALVVAYAEPDGVVLTGDEADLGALAEVADRVRVQRI